MIFIPQKKFSLESKNDGKNEKSVGIRQKRSNLRNVDDENGNVIA